MYEWETSTTTGFSSFRAYGCRLSAGDNYSNFFDLTIQNYQGSSATGTPEVVTKRSMTHGTKGPVEGPNGSVERIEETVPVRVDMSEYDGLDFGQILTKTAGIKNCS